MGDPQTLVDFVNWGIDNYLALHYAVVVWDHGDGWYKKTVGGGDDYEGDILFKGVSWDDTDGDNIGVSDGEWESAISAIRHHLGRNINLYGFDACLMQMWEVLDITDEYADYMVGSEEVENFDGWNYTQFLSALIYAPTMSPEELGKEIVDAAVDGDNQSTQSCVDLAQVPALTTAVDDFADELLVAIGDPAHKTTIDNIRTQLHEFWISSHIDLYDFADSINSEATLPSDLRTAANGVINAVNTAVTWNRFQSAPDYTWAKGIAIYYPADPSDYDHRYDNLPVASNTLWDDYLKGGRLFIRGDFAADGIVDMCDVDLILTYYFEDCPSGQLCLDAADVNDDGEIRMSDALMLADFVKGVPGSIPPQPPYPDCGIDTTDDDLDCEVHYYCMGIDKPLMEFIRGDYDGDGQVLTNDPLAELQWIFGVPCAPPPCCMDAADYDDDGAVLTNDPLMALQWLFGVPGSAPPDPPFPTCGTDPTEDELDCRWHIWCYCHTGGGKAFAYKPSVSVESAENKVMVDEVASVDGVVRVPVDLTVTEAVCGFDISLGYDASCLHFVEVVGGDGYDFYAVDTREEGVVRIGGVPDIEMAEFMGAGTHRIAEIVFTVEDSEADVKLKWEKVEVYGANVEPLSVEWVDGLVKAGTGLPKEFALGQNYPNPFNPITEIRYALPRDCWVRMEIYNILGQKVATLVDGKQKAGHKTARWDASTFSSGIYFSRLQAGDFVQTRKMVLIR